jgi:tellurite resistance protein TerC
MRGIFIGLGAALVQQFHWIEYVFGVFLIYTGGKLLFAGDTEVEPEKNPALRWFRRVIPSIDEYRGTKFFVVENGKRLATPLFMVLLTVEATDVVFAVDSIPAVFSVTTDPFIVYTSNIFAILGLRSLFFVLSGMMDKFRYLNVGLGFVLGFVGLKMLISDFYPVPIGWSLGAIAGILGTSIVASLLNPAPPPLPHPTDESEVGDGDYRRTAVPEEPTPPAPKV